MSVHKNAKRITTHTLQTMKEHGEKIAMLTAYDYSLAKIVEMSADEYRSVPVGANRCMGKG